MNLRIAQISLLLSALLIALLNRSFNGLSLLALACVAITGYIAWKPRASA